MKKSAARNRIDNSSGKLSNVNRGIKNSPLIAPSKSLPELGIKRIKREANITPKVLKWLRESDIGCCAVEIKATATDSIPESAVAPHQVLALQAASGEGIVHKISDEARRKQPFDAFKLANVPAYVVACFTARGVCIVIPIAEWKGARYNMGGAYVRFEI